MYANVCGCGTVAMCVSCVLKNGKLFKMTDMQMEHLYGKYVENVRQSWVPTDNKGQRKKNGSIINIEYNVEQVHVCMCQKSL